MLAARPLLQSLPRAARSELKFAPSAILSSPVSRNSLMQAVVLTSSREDLREPVSNREFRAIKQKRQVALAPALLFLEGL